MVVALHGSGVARAQGQSAAQAEALFREGKALMAQQRFEAACPKFAASQKLDPGVGTLLNLADCHDKVGKTASAWAEFLEAATLARRSGQSERVRVARERAEALEPRLIRLTLKVPDSVRRLRDLEIKLDGQSVPEPTWGTATPIDPGPHLVAVTASGKKEWAKAIDAQGEGASLSLEVPFLEDAPVEETPAQRGTPTDGGTKRTIVVDEGSGQRTLGLILGGVGLAGIAVGSVFGLSARNKWDDANCSGGTCPTSADQELSDDARSNASIATIAYIAGGAFLGGGIILYAAAPGETTKEVVAKRPVRRTAVQSVQLTPAVAPTGGGVFLNGTF